MSDIPELYIIHKSGRGYYMPEAKGYTVEAAEAGLFTLKEAEAYTHPNGLGGPRDGLTYKRQSEIKSGENCGKDLLIHDLKAERDELRKGQEILSQQISESSERIALLEAQIRGYDAAAEVISRALSQGTKETK